MRPYAIDLFEAIFLEAMWVDMLAEGKRPAGISRGAFVRLLTASIDSQLASQRNGAAVREPLIKVVSR